MERASEEARRIDRLMRWGTATGEDDGRLLERFRLDRDESAFAALVDRHGPMVLGVCRRILRDDRDVEDAFQATFLVLVRRAATIRGADRVGPWIHGVAHRVAVRARADAARRYVREGVDLEVEPAVAVAPSGPAERSELRSILDEELGRLPERLRAPLILCHLEGLTHEQAAARLQQPVGTIRSRLSRGRDRLRDRLTRRGVTADCATASLILADPVPSGLLEAAVRSSLAFASSRPDALASAGAAALASGILDAMVATKMKITATALGAVLTLGGASGYALQEAADGAGGTPVGVPLNSSQSALRGVAPLESISIAEYRRWKQRHLELTVEKMDLEHKLQEVSEALARSQRLLEEGPRSRNSELGLTKVEPQAAKQPSFKESLQKYLEEHFRQLHELRAQSPGLDKEIRASEIKRDSLKSQLTVIEMQIRSTTLRRDFVQAQIESLSQDIEVVRRKLRDLDGPAKSTSPTTAPAENQ